MMFIIRSAKLNFSAVLSQKIDRIFFITID